VGCTRLVNAYVTNGEAHKSAKCKALGVKHKQTSKRQETLPSKSLLDVNAHLILLVWSISTFKVRCRSHWWNMMIKFISTIWMLQELECKGKTWRKGKIGIFFSTINLTIFFLGGESWANFGDKKCIKKKTLIPIGYKSLSSSIR
jgi:hypothetical protein